MISVLDVALRPLRAALLGASVEWRTRLAVTLASEEIAAAAREGLLADPRLADALRPALAEIAGIMRRAEAERACVVALPSVRHDPEPGDLVVANLALGGSTTRQIEAVVAGRRGDMVGLRCPDGVHHTVNVTAIVRIHEADACTPPGAA